MKRREFIKNGIIILGAPAIIKIENLMKIATPRETKLVENTDLSFNEFQKAIIREFAAAFSIPVDLLMMPIQYEPRM